MSEVQLGTSPSGKTLFFIEDNGERVGRLYVKEDTGILTAIHTEVLPQAEGKGLAKKLFLAMVKHAREHSMKVIAECPYVRAQFQRNPEEYRDIWMMDNSTPPSVL